MSTFDASPSMLGFVHQMRWALYELLVAIRSTGDETLRVSIETYDDVAVHDSDGRPLTAVQLKQHQEDGQALSDGHPDLWKTLRVWLSSGALADAEGPHLFLLTTVGVSADSAPSMLMDTDRDVEKALNILNDKAETLQSKGTDKARAAWREADEATKTALLERMTVVAASPRIHDVDRLVGNELRATMSQASIDGLLPRLWGWWDGRCIDMLNPDRTEPALVAASELLSRIRTLRDEMREDSLTITPESDIDAVSIERGYDERFIEQLRWITTNANTLHRAVVDYLRAYAHTARWIRDGELFDVDLKRYELALKAEWDVHFDDMCVELEMDGITDEVERKRAGWNLFKLLRDSTDVHIRTGFPEAFHARGSRYGIANTGSHGWHPDFQERMAKLLEQAA
ncbi:ABC-three component system protein [uncultured Curtobacterium sp.]|uniref:ABC-three component system protein n=1 Tax=uncultured Curtobacterium sp. TaxID=331964 RepID=UPI00258A6582|nr:ABC-three component system protein [uncultured Curtobacterium sp.]